MISDKFIDAEGFLAGQLKFLHRAVGDDETRYFMKELLIEPSEKGGGLLRGVATDGRHLHIVDPLSEAATKVYEMTPGFWRVLRSYDKKERIWLVRLGDKETANWHYPNWQKVVPNGEGVEYRTTFNGFAWNDGIGTNTSQLAVFFHDFPDATALRLGYLEALGIDCPWEVEWYGPQKIIKFIASDRVAVIMPLAID
jgi:hypothetical protein